MIDLDSGGTILTGQNGSGKTTIMKAVHFAAAGRFAELAQLPISKLTLTFGEEAGEKFSVTSGDSGDITVEDSNGHSWPVPVAAAGQPDRAAHARMRAAEARSRPEREHFLQIAAEESESADDDAPTWVKNFRENFKTTFVSTRRLESERPKTREEAMFEIRNLAAHVGAWEETPRLLKVDDIAEDIGVRIRRELAQEANKSRAEEKGLPEKIVKAVEAGYSGDGLSVEVTQLKGEVDELANALAGVGVLPVEEASLAHTEETDKPVLLAIREVYKQRKERLETLTPFSKRLELFLNFMNRDRFTGKRVELRTDVGVAVILPDGEEIELGKLSSGEQQLMVLAHELLFDTASHSVVLIDEPELSLHVSWLRGLMAAFLDIGTSRDLQFLVATHAPAVVAEFRENEFSLDELAT